MSRNECNTMSSRAEGQGRTGHEKGGAESVQQGKADIQYRSLFKAEAETAGVLEWW